MKSANVNSIPMKSDPTKMATILIGGVEEVLAAPLVSQRSQILQGSLQDQPLLFCNVDRAQEGMSYTYFHHQTKFNDNSNVENRYVYCQ